MKKLLVLLLSFALFGCSKSMITPEILMNIARNEGYIAGQLKAKEDMISHTQAIEKNGNIRIDFYEYETVDKSSEKFNEMQEDLKNVSELKKSEDKIEYIRDRKHIYISKLDNTILKVSYNKEFEKNVKDIIDKIGY